MRFIFPIDGDVLTPADGRMEGESLMVAVKVEADKDSAPKLNDIPMTLSESGDKADIYSLEIPIDGYRNALVCRDKNGAESVIYVFRFKNAYKKYRLAIDDIVWSMRDLAENSYASIFDQSFFRLFRDIHDEFGTLIQFNIYYTDMNGFDLTMFPDRYKKDFEGCADWLKLTFHAIADSPDRIYRYTPYSEIMRDYNLVTNEILRFAGPETMNTAVNGLHWAETTRDGARALRAAGIKCLVGYYIFDENGDPHVAYYLNHDETVHASGRDSWVDNREGIIFSKDKMVIDSHKLENIPAFLDDLRDNHPCEAGTMNFVTHEQYFYPHYKGYQSDYGEKIKTAVRWATQNGYTPCFLDRVITEEYPY